MLILWLPLILIINIFVSVSCFNLDVDHPIIIENPDILQKNSYFGQSVVLYSDGEHDEKWVKIGAPKATFHYGHDEVIQSSGIVYHCPYMKKCEVEHRLNYHKKNFNVHGNLTDAWTGGSMDISYKYKTFATSAPNWHYFVNNKREKSPRIPGRIFVEHFQNKSSPLEKCSPLTDPEVVGGVSYYARSQAGLSMHFAENKSELLIGAPGVYNYLGTIIRISNIDQDKPKWRFSVKKVQGKYLEYLGYAVTSGYFFGKNELCYVTGLPRGLRNAGTIMYGAVNIFTFTSNRADFENQYRIRQRVELYGSQFGEYFGASLAAGDLNGDHLDDLIVGAPFRKNNKDGYNHGSVYVIYGDKTTKQFETKRGNTLEGTVANGLFGLAVMFLGDLDQDGYKEFAVSAPKEESSGVIYIYTYHKPTNKLVLFQRIMGKKIHADLKGFGMSFSRTKDIDDNHFSDIVVGSPISGHAVLLRSKPTVHVDISIRVNSTISKSNDTLFFQCCYQYKDYREPTLNITRTVTVDGDYQRFMFTNKRHVDEQQIKIEIMKITCEDISVSKVSKKINYQDSINLTLTLSIPENPTANAHNPVLISNDRTMGNDTFCKKCPLLSKRSLRTETQLVMWDQLCNEKKCEAELIVRAKFVNLSPANTFVLGSKEYPSLKIIVSNNGDPAFLPLLKMVLPNGVYLSNDPANCEIISDVATVMCDLGDQLKKEVTFNFELNIDEGTSEKELMFLVNSSTTTSNRDNQSSTNIILNLERVADFELTGESKESSYIYRREEITVIQNIFKIEKFGPSPMSEIVVNIKVPYKIRDSQGIFQNFAEIRDKNDDQVPKCQNVTALEEFYPENDLPTFDLSKSDDAGLVKNKTLSLFNATNIFHINCTTENVRCVHIICSVGPFNNVQKYAEVIIEAKLNFDKLEDMLLLKESILITSEANILLDNFTQNGNRSDYTEVSNLLIIEKDYRISFWILIGSAIAGFLILICLTGGLAKAGFFERKEQKKLMILKEEALEEERILEAMIEREFSNGDCEEENELYGLAFIRKREPIKEINDENELYDGLL